MANPIAGWYPDPSGDASKLRYWDGNQWTDAFMDRPLEIDVPAEASVVEVEDAIGDEAVVAEAQEAPASQASAEPVVVEEAVKTEQVAQQAQPEPVYQAQVAQEQASAQPQQEVGSAGSSSATWTAGGQSFVEQPYVQSTVVVDYPANELDPEDRTLRLIAFVFALITTIISGWALLPLAWMIPMTVHCWSLYKGKKANTVAFGVCTLIFVDIVSGILLLVSSKENQQ